MPDKIDPLHVEWLEAIETEGINLTTWEEEFVESIRSRINRGEGLTPGQAGSLERIYANRTP